MRPLQRVPVPPGPAGVDALIEPLTRALDGTGPAIAPIPVTSVTVSDAYVQRLLEAMRPDDPAHPLESDDIAVVLATSGSTGAPRGVLHTAGSLTALTTAVNGPGRPQWIAALPLSSMGGFNVLIRSLAAERTPIALPSLGGLGPFTAADFTIAVDAAARVTDDVRVSLVAAQVRRLLDDEASIDALRRCREVLVGAGPTPITMRTAARELGIALTSTYGATETAGGCVYDGRPLPGVSLRIEDSVVVDGPMLARGYRLEPELTAERFTERGFRTMDLGTLVDGVLTIHGRSDDVVIVNGVNVSLGAIERAIADSPEVAEVVALAIPGDEPTVIAVVAPRADGVIETSTSMATTVEQALGRAAVPRRVAIVPAIPHLPNGKPDRARILNDVLDGGLTWLP